MPGSLADALSSHSSLVAMALKEDHAAADATSLAVVPENAQAQGGVIAKAEGVLAGTSFADAVFQQVGGLTLDWKKQQGERLSPGDLVFRVVGSARALLAGERTALNFLQQLSGVATLTAQAVASAGSLAVLDTRKTIPGLRKAQKEAVVAGGGVNHRRDLADQLLLKENHFALSGLSYQATVKRALQEAQSRLVGVEAETPEQARQALLAGAHYVMLDDFPADLLREVAPQLRKEFPHAVLEVSGSLTPEKLSILQVSGITRISMGALTHSAPALDLSFFMEPIL